MMMRLPHRQGRIGCGHADLKPPALCLVLRGLGLEVADLVLVVHDTGVVLRSHLVQNLFGLFHVLVPKVVEHFIVI